MVVNAVVVTEFANYDRIILSVDVADSVATTFKPFGIGHDPSIDRVQGRINKSGLEKVARSWRHSEVGSVVYWLGHGRGPAMSRLLDSSSDPKRPLDGIGAQDLMEDICRIGGESKFILIILEACRSAGFVQDLKNGLMERPDFNCATLIFYSKETVTIPHDVLTELRQILDDVFGAEPEFYLANLRAEFEIRSKAMSVACESLNMSDEVLRRTAPVPVGQTLDIHRRLRRLLETLSDDEREHFVSKAQSAGTGELTWNFEGRDHERQTVLTWLKADKARLCIVRGEAGQGKSAFLGDIVTRCRTDLADGLVQAGLMTPIESWREIGSKFLVISINASGISTEHLVERALRGLGDSSQVDPVLDELLDRIERLVETLDRRVVFVIDGVDEMQDPVEGARTIGALSSRRRVKVLVACRDTPNEGQQFFAYVHADLVQSILETASVEQAVEIVLGPDPEAIERYVRRRLQEHLVDRVLPERLDLPFRDFLHASVLVREIAFDPEWLEWELLSDLVKAGLPELYDMVLRRLSAANPAFMPLFYACALSQGRGLPIAGEVWLTIARAIDGSDDRVDQKSLMDFLNLCEQYLRVDIEHGQTVYRPGHSLLRSFILSMLNDVSSCHRLLATICASQVGGGSSNAYYRHSATMHARRSNHEGWWAIDRIAPPVWELLDHQRVVEDAMRDLFGRTRMPSGVEDLVLSHHFTAHLGQVEPAKGWSQALRRGTYRAPENAGHSKTTWLRWAKGVIRQPVFLSLPGDRGRVTVIRDALLGPGEAGLLVATARGDVWLWNLASGGVVTTFKGLSGGIFAVDSVSDPDHGLVVIAGDDTGHLAAWSAKSRQQLWSSSSSIYIEQAGERADRSGPVLGIASVDLECAAEGAIVVTSHHLFLVGFLEGTLVAMKRAKGFTFGSNVASFKSEDGVLMIAVSTEYMPGVAIFEVAPADSGWLLRQRDFVTLPSQLKSFRRVHETSNTFQLLLSDGGVMQWAFGTPPKRSIPPVGGSLTLGDVSGSITGLVDVSVDNDSNVLKIRHIDADRNQRQVIASHGGKPTAVRVIDRAGGRALAASGGTDRTVRVWDPYSSGSEETHDASLVRRVLALPAGGGKTLVVAALQNGNIQFLDGASARIIKSWPLRMNITSLASSVADSGRALVVAGTEKGHIYLWKQNGLDKPQKLTLPGTFGSGVVVDVDPSGELVATVSPDGLVTVWAQTHQFEQKFEEQVGPLNVTAVKVFKPFDDLVVVLVLTLDGVYCLEFERQRSRWVTRPRHVEHRLPQSKSVSFYADGTRMGLLSGSTDGQVHSIPRLWTPKANLSADDRAALISLNLRQPITAIDVHISLGRTIVVVAGAYGRIVKAYLHEHLEPRLLDLGQHIGSVSAPDDKNLLAAVQGGVVSLTFGEDL